MSKLTVNDSVSVHGVKLNSLLSFNVCAESTQRFTLFAFFIFFFYPTNQNTEVIICFSKTLCRLEVNTRRTDRCLTGKLRLSINSSSRHSDDLMAEIAPWINIFINNTQWTWKRKISELQRNRQRKQNLTEQTLEYSSWISDPGRPA